MGTTKYLIILLSLSSSTALMCAPRNRIISNTMVQHAYRNAPLSEEERDGLLLTSCFDIVAHIVKLGVDNPNNQMSAAEKQDIHGIINSLQMFAHTVVRKYPVIAARSLHLAEDLLLLSYE